MALNMVHQVLEDIKKRRQCAQETEKEKLSEEREPQSRIKWK
jgi:hypothetical protein